MRRTALLFAAAAATLWFPASAGPKYWAGGDGYLFDTTMWTYGSALPTPNDNVWFTHGTYFTPVGERSSRVTLPSEVQIVQLLLSEPNNDWTGVAGVQDTCPVTLVGPSTLMLQDLRYSGTTDGRDLAFENVDVVFTNYQDNLQTDGGWRVYGRSLWRDSSLTMTNRPMYFTAGAGSEFVLDNSTILIDKGTFSANARHIFKSGDYRALRNSSTLTATNVQVRGAHLHAPENCYAKEWFPSETNGLLEVTSVSDYSFQPTLVGGEKIALRGKLMATNNTNATVSKFTLTNSVAIYGRGTINASTQRMTTGYDYDFDVANLEIGYRLTSISNKAFYAKYPSVKFRNGVTFRAYDTRPGGNRNFDIVIPVDLYGHVSFDSRDIYTGVLRKLSQGSLLLAFQHRSGLEYHGFIEEGIGYVPVRFARYDIGDSTTVTNKTASYGSVSCRRRTHSFHMGAGAKIQNPDYDQIIEVTGEVDVDPTASIMVEVNSPGNNVYPLFSSLHDGPIPCTVGVPFPTEGCSVKWVGGSAYYSTGAKAYTVANGYWNGSEDGYWSNTANWGNGTQPSSSYDATFTGETRTIVTNDVDNAKCLKLGCVAGAPFIIRGDKAVCPQRKGLGNGDAAGIASSSIFPFVVECPVVANVNLICRTDQGSSYGFVALKGDVDAKNGVFGASGNIVVGGKVECRDLMIQQAAQHIKIGYPAWVNVWTNFTELTVLAGGKIYASAQAITNTAAGSIWIDRGGLVSVVGDWTCNTAANEHQVNGLLDLSSATLRGDATQGYFGSGVVRVSATDGSDGASVRFGEGVTLETTASTWGTMPIDMASGFTISNATDWTYSVAGGIRASALGHALTVYAGGTTTIETGIDGYDFDVVKKGPGVLVVNGGCSGLGRGVLDLREGAVAFEGDLRLRRLSTRPGTTIAFDAVGGTPAKVIVDDDVDVTGVSFRPADAVGEAEMSGRGYQTVLTVPWYCVIKGEPAADKRFAVRTIVNADGSRSLQCKPVFGLSIIVR